MRQYLDQSDQAPWGLSFFILERSGDDVRSSDEDSCEKKTSSNFTILFRQLIFRFDSAGDTRTAESKSSASKANNDCQILLFDVHAVTQNPKNDIFAEYY